MKNAKQVLLISIFIIFGLNFHVLNGQISKKSAATGYGDATYSGLSDDVFMKSWMVLGPVKIDKTVTNPNENKQKEAFENDLLTSFVVQPKKNLANVKLGDTIYAWKAVKFEDGIIDFDKLFNQLDFSIGYALAEIKMDNPEKVLVGIGSDDGVKVFLNGKLVHSNWIGRALKKDDDILFLDLKKGSNQILIKVQDMQYDWSFCIRKLGKNTLNANLVEASGSGNLDKVKLLIANGADINSPNDLGLTAYQNAMIKGREEIMVFLKEKGAKTNTSLPSFEKLIEYIFKSVKNSISSGVAVLVAQNGKIIYEKSFGFADVGNEVPVTPDTKFRIGSVSKQFIAASILKLQEEGRLNVKDSLSKFIPDFPRGNEVTLHHLLTHTSGIHSYTNRPDFLKYCTMQISPSALVDTIKAYPYDFNPGEKYSYCNSGFFILGYIVEQISGKTLNDYLTETFFKPLGMTSTGIHNPYKLLKNEAYGYSYENGEIVKALNWDMSWAGGAGALYSTVKDLYLWNEAIFNGKVLSDISMKSAFAPGELNNKEKTDYGYGWGISKYRGLNIIGHTGGLHGFLSSLARQPESNTTVIVLCNSTPPPDGIMPGSNSYSIMEYLLWPKMEKQKSYADIQLDEKTMKLYIGQYDYGQSNILNVTFEDGQLYAQMTNQPKFPIFPMSNNEFYWKIVEASIKFIIDEKGIVTGAIHSQGGGQLNVKKIQ